MTATANDSLRPIDAALTHLVVPPRAPTEGRPPGLLLLHGRGSDERDLVGLAGALDPRLLVVSARAPARLGPGYHWYDLYRVGEPEPAGFGRSLDLLGRFVEEIVAGYNIAPERLFLLGFSQGAVMSGAVTLTRPNTVAGAVLLSGYLPLRSGLAIDEAGLRGRPVFIGHGTWDGVIGVDFGREANAFLTGIGADVTYREYPMEHSVGEAELRDIAAWLTGRLDAGSPAADGGAGAGAARGEGVTRA